MINPNNQTENHKNQFNHSKILINISQKSPHLPPEPFSKCPASRPPRISHGPWPPVFSPPRPPQAAPWPPRPPVAPPWMLWWSADSWASPAWMPWRPSNGGHSGRPLWQMSLELPTGCGISAIGDILGYPITGLYHGYEPLSNATPNDWGKKAWKSRKKTPAHANHCSGVSWVFSLGEPWY